MYDNNENNNEINLEQNVPQESQPLQAEPQAVQNEEPQAVQNEEPQAVQNEEPQAVEEAKPQEPQYSAPQQQMPPPPPPPPYGGYYQNGGYGHPNNGYNYNWNLNDYGGFATPPKKPKNGNGFKILAVALCCVLFVAAIGFGVAGLNALVTDVNVTSSKQTMETSSTIVDAPDLVINNKPTDTTGTFDNDSALSGERVYEKVSPSVVGIVVYSSATNTSASGEGSGVIISSDGYIVTNSHVIENAKLIEVVLNNNERYTAKLMGNDAQTDLAVIKIDAENLVKAELGNSDELKPGEVVYAIGNPGGIEFANSITNGIISGVDRIITNSSTGYLMTCIQTNAAINPGNSGGALVDSYGRVVGISVAKLSNVSYEGMGFAIPISDSLELISNLIEYGYVKGRPLLGITYQAISSQVAEFYGIPAGIMVDGIDPESDAYAKGLRPGDTITAFNGQHIENSSQIFNMMAKCKPGDVMKLTVYRQDRTAELSVVLGENVGRDTSHYITKQSGGSSGNNQGYGGNNNGNSSGSVFEDPFGFFPFG